MVTINDNKHINSGYMGLNPAPGGYHMLLGN